MIKLPALGVNGRTAQAFLTLPSVSPPPWLAEPPPAVGAGEAADPAWFVAGGAWAFMKEVLPSTTAGVSTGAATTTGTLRTTRGITITVTFCALRFFRFEIFFFADTPSGTVKSTSTTEIAIIDTRTGLTIFGSPLRPLVFQVASSGSVSC